MTQVLRFCGWILAGALVGGNSVATPLSRAQALVALSETDPAVRLAALDRLSQVGKMADSDVVLKRLADDEQQVRESAQRVIWQIWSRTGDAAVDKLFARGVEEMRTAALGEALATFSEIVRRRPAFAEAWNKRATVYFMLGQNEQSLKDCDEVLRRNPKHFGALSGSGQIHLRMGHVRRAFNLLQRAVEVNPNLEGPAQIIPQLEERLRDEERNTT